MSSIGPAELGIIAAIVALFCFGTMAAVGLVVYFVTRSKKNDESLSD